VRKFDMVAVRIIMHNASGGVINFLKVKVARQCGGTY
jgi:hypothetical protein